MKRELLPSEQPGFVQWGEPGWAPMQAPTLLTVLVQAAKSHPWKCQEGAFRDGEESASD